MAHDILQIKTSTNTDKNNDASYNEIEESWLLKKNIEFPQDISDNQQINLNLNFNKNTFIQDISYGVIELNESTNISETNVRIVIVIILLEQMIFQMVLYFLMIIMISLTNFCII